MALVDQVERKARIEKAAKARRAQKLQSMGLSKDQIKKEEDQRQFKKLDALFKKAWRSIKSWEALLDDGEDLL